MHPIAQQILGPHRGPSQTDAYKWSMARAGFPTREETFYLSCRKAHMQITHDLRAIVRDLTVAMCEKVSVAHYPQYPLTPEMQRALRPELVKGWFAPEGVTVPAGCPILTLTGPSFLLSALEPQLEMLAYWLRVPKDHKFEMTEEMAKGIRFRATEIIRAADGYGVFEVGLRAAVSMDAHRQILDIICEEGITRTSNLGTLPKQRMIPVGTCGHEHQQRHGSDLAAYRAIEGLDGIMPSYLPDTYNVWDGIKIAIDRIQSRSNKAAIRLDSGDLLTQMCYVWGMAVGLGISDRTVLIIEDGLTPQTIHKMVEVAKDLGIPKTNLSFGVGGYLCNLTTWLSIPHRTAKEVFGSYEYSRDSVACVWKLSRTAGTDVWKRTPGKQSLPGVPITASFSTGAIRQAEEGDLTPLMRDA